MRAVFELAKRNGQGPVKISEIAKTQFIPARFLENILNELKQGSFVDSRRGKNGGYYLAREPEAISMGEIIRFVDGPFNPVDCLTDCPTDRCKFYGDCVFLPIWEQISETVAEIYDKISFQNLLEQEEKRAHTTRFNYAI